MAKREFSSIDEVSAAIKTELDTPNADNADKTKKVSIIYASNSSGKTRLSKKVIY